MLEAFGLARPKLLPPLDDDFRPAVLANRAYRAEVEASGGGVPLVFGLERPDGSRSRFETQVFAEGHPRAEANAFYAERLLKFLLWQRGGYKVHVGGPRNVGEHIQSCYAPGGARAYDHETLGHDIYNEPFQVVVCDASQVPGEREPGRPLGRHLEGCRTARLPRVDAIGGSSAGVYVDNQPRLASIFRGVPRAQFDRVRTLFLRIGDEWGVPLEIVNDGEVAALAGSMFLGDKGVLGLALGSSEAGGYVRTDGNMTTWLNELSFAPIDYSPTAPLERWSGDRGVGARYFSQQCVFRLAPRAGITIPQAITNAEKLEFVQRKLEAGHRGATQIWQSMGIYMGYAIAHYADFYELRHVLILGRCTSGRGGPLLLDGAAEVLRTEFPELNERIRIQLPDEVNRRVGQSIAAASLPVL